MIPWKPKMEEEVTSIGHWLIDGHDVFLEQRVCRQQDYPWQDERSYAQWRGTCATCYKNHQSNWQTTKEAATKDLECHLEEYRLAALSTQIFIDVKEHHDRVGL